MVHIVLRAPSGQLIALLALLVQVIQQISMFSELAIPVAGDNSQTLEKIHVVTATQVMFVSKMLSQTSHRTSTREVIPAQWDSTVQQERTQRSHAL